MLPYTPGARIRNQGELVNYKYFINRIVYFIILFFITLTVGFAIPRAIPGNPADAVLARIASHGGYVSPSLLKSVYQEMGISTKPVYIQYFSYLSNLFHGNLGVSITYFPEPVINIIYNSLIWTVLLILVPVVIAFYLGNWLGRKAALSRGKTGDAVSTMVPMFFYGIPAFALGAILLEIFGIQLKILPELGSYSFTTTPGLNAPFIISIIKHAILPITTIVLTTLSSWVFGMRNNMVTILNSNFLKYSNLMGVKQNIINKNASRNAILPNMTSFGIAIGFAITGVIMIQQIFSYQGLGEYLFQGIEGLDYPLVNGIFIVIILISLIANFGVEMIYGILDPRIRS